MVSPDLNAKIKALEQQLKLYGAVFQRLDVGVHVIDLEQNTVLYNPAMGKFEGEDPAKVMGRPLLEALSFLQEKDSTLLRVLRSRQALPDLKQSYGNSQGQAVVTINSNQPLFIDGQMVGALEIAKDVTYVQRLSEKILDLHEHISQRKKNPERAPGEQVITAEVRYRFEQILGRSATMARVLKQAQRMAQTSSNVLIYGETGTGKELFVQSIHAASARSAQPFIDVNCAALPSQLLEGLLFGSVKGSFTDAQDRAGLFEQAHRGTLLLDEVNSMHPELQGKLLRVLQEKNLRRLGASKNTEIDVRVIATMNVAPDTAIARKELREDLYYRLSVASLHIPPLRERPEDIALYAEYFLQRYSQSLGRAVKACSPPGVRSFFASPVAGQRQATGARHRRRFEPDAARRNDPAARPLANAVQERLCAGHKFIGRRWRALACFGGSAPRQPQKSPCFDGKPAHQASARRMPRQRLTRRPANRHHPAAFTIQNQALPH